MSKTIDDIKCGNYEVVDNHGVSITRHFTQCLEKEFADLEAKLAEKENEIKKLTEELDDKNFCKDFVDLYTENKLKTQMLHENWKDKISFAIAELEKVKEHFINIKTPTLGVIRRAEMVMYIDNQIKQLKEGN